MQNFKQGWFLTVSLMFLLLAGNASASMTERMEGKFLKNRIKQRIDEGWLFQNGNVSGAQAIAFNDASWTATNVPHDMSITLVKPVGAPGNDPGAMGWYRKHFTLPAGFAGKKVIIQFDGVYHDSKIYLNGDSVGAQKYGYVSFTCDLTSHLNATGDNVLAVFVDNLTIRTSRWYSGTGIFRHVWLIATDNVYVRNWGTAVTTAAPTQASSQVRVQTDVVNALTTAQTRTVKTTIYDEAGNALQTASSPVTVNPGSIDTCVQTLTLTSCNLWSIATPVRYYAYTQLLSGTTPADDYVTPFGIREIKYNATSGMTINGAAVKLKGICMHQMLVPAGSAVPDEMFERCIKELKASGCTSIRTSHNPEGPEFYDICDQVGIMVMDEFCDKWSETESGSYYEDFANCWQKDLTLHIERDRNHPSVVIWSLGNEVASAGTIPAYITTNLQMLVTFAKNIDKTRPYTHACVAGWSDPAGFANLANIEDVVGVNYQDFLYPQIHSDNANAVICGTEQDPYTNPGSLQPTWFAVRNTAYVIGHHIWTGVDYIGESGGLGSAGGYLDNCIFRKSWFYYQQAQWSDSPMVHITIGNGAGSGRAMPTLAENWNQTGSVSVVTYTNCDSVSLYVNATKIGTEKLSSFPSDMIMQWTSVPWASGTIKAIGMKGGVQAAFDSMNTAGPAAKIILKPDHTTLYADGEDAASIEVDVADANNNLVYTAANEISFSFTGAGRSLGIASGDWTSSEPFKATSRAAYHGKALIVIQSTTVPGTINVTVSSGTLTSATLALTTVAQQINTAIRGPASMNTLASGRASLLSCVQNPGSKNIRVGYRVDVPGTVNLSVISSSGRAVSCLTNKYHQTGTYSLEWNPVNKSAVYFFVLKTSNDKTIRKALLVQ
ncbi:MAG: glycoside hydrolase family 2 TIM barrel-domain containing protein [Chitinivibrionales bacterium]